MRLVVWMFRLVALAAVVWFATSVPLGRRTLWSHLQAIWSTPEAQELAQGTRDEAGKVAERVREGVGRKPEAPAATEKLDAADRRALDRLVRERTHVEEKRP